MLKTEKCNLEPLNLKIKSLSLVFLKKNLLQRRIQSLIGMLKKNIVIFVILCSLEFYNLTFIPESITKLIGIAGIGVIVVFLIIHFIYDQKIQFKLNFKIEVWILLLAVFLSMFIAYYGHGQAFKYTLVAQRFMYVYLFYFLLAYLKPDKDDLMKIIVYLAIAYFIIYLIQYSIYPSRIFKGRVSLDRGTIRIFLPGYTYLLTAYFIGLYQFYNFKKLRYVAVSGIVVIILILQGTRQSIAAIGLLTIISILFSKQAKSKFAYIFMILLGVVAVFFLFQDIVMNLIEVSMEQKEKSTDDIRVLSATFFLTEFMPNKFAYILGNGMDSTNAEYGILMQYYRSALGFYQSDVGIIGTYSRFGLLFILAELAIYFKIFKKKLPNDIIFIKYVFIYNFLTIVTGSDSFNGMDGIVAISILLYLVDISLFELET